MSIKSLRSFASTFVSIIIFLTLAQQVSAITVTRGQGATINWNVQNAPNCAAQSNYPILSEINNWNGRSLPGSGSERFNSVTAVGTWSFTCNYNGIIGSDTLTVLDCSGGTTWNGSSCVVASCGNGATNPPSCDSFPPCGNGATNPPTCNSFPPCGNGATNPPTCNSFPPCGNGATNPPSCNVFPPCGNGANNPPSCNTFDPCSNGATNPPSCTVFPSCGNGAINPPTCNVFPPCGNGANNPPSCNTFNPCSNGATNPPSCNVFPSCGNGANNPPACNSCTGPLVWNGSSCVAPPATGSLTVPGSCQIAVGASTCTVTASWTTSNASTPRLIDGNSGATLSTSPSGSQTVWVGYGGTSFELNNGGTPLDSGFTSGNCTSGNAWDGSSCQPTACGNGATNPPTCNSFPPCGNGANNPPSCNTFDPCSNGATNPPTCDSFSACGNGATNPPACNVFPSCPNGANNPPACNSCTGPLVWNGSSCVAPAVASGNLTLSQGTCTVASGASTCTVTASWTTSNASTPRLIDGNTGTTLSTAANSGGLTVWVAYGGTSFDLNNGGTTLDNGFVGTVCANGNAWNGSTCSPTACGNGATNPPTCNSFPPCGNGATNPPSCNVFPSCGNGATNPPACDNFSACGNGATNPPACNIFPSCGNGAINPPACNACNPGFTFNGSSCVVSSCGNGATNPPACNVFPSCTNGATNYPACNACNFGFVFDGSNCVVPAASGNISASPTSCTIAANASTCSVLFTWSSSNVSSPNVRNNTTGQTYSTSANGNNQSYSVTNGNNTVQLRDGSSVLGSANVNAGCISGTSWVGGVCQYSAPTISASFSPSTVNAGTNFSLNWNASNATNVTANCTGNGATAFQTLSFTPATGNTRSGSTDNSMHGNTTCTLTANGPGGSVTSASFSITINPVCPATAPWDGNQCVNPPATISLSPTTASAIIDTPVSYTITTSDTGDDITAVTLNWRTPGQSQWNWENGNVGASVTPTNGSITLFPGVDSHVDIFSFIPNVPGTYTIYGAVLDNGGTRWAQTAEYTLTVSCTAGYININFTCVNPRPVVNMTPTGTITIPLGQSINLTSLATDASSDITTHNLEWQKPNGTWNWATPGLEWGTVTYNPVGNDNIPGGTGNSNLQATFTPDHIGYYTVRFAAQDNTLSNYDGHGPWWTYPSSLVIAVVNGTTAVISQDPSNASRIRWECFNSNRATLVTTGGPTTNDFVDRTLPPSSGTFTATPGATYTLTCRNTATNQTDVAVYAQPTITTPTPPTTTTITPVYACNNASAQSSTLEMIPGNITLNAGTSGTRTDSGLTPGTEYIYTLRCFSAPGGTGSQVGATTVRVTTVTASPPAFTLSAYIQRVSSDPTTYSSTQPISVSTPDGQFYGWSYRVTGGVAQSCIMDQRNDNSSWYPQPGYASATSTYTFLFSSLSAQDRTAFASSFTNAHYWRLTCSDSVGRSSSLIWSLDKSGAFPTVVDATLNLNCTPPPPAPTISVQCANADYYEVRNNTTNALVTSGAGTIGTASLPNTDATYRITCKQGGSTGTANAGQYLRTYNTSMCGTTITNFTATPRTIKAGSVSTLQWTISQPTASCTLTAAPVCASGVCNPVTDAVRITNADDLTKRLELENTDANDPNNINGDLRSVASAVNSEAFNNGVPGYAMGKKSLRILNTTDFILNCGAGVQQRVRILVSDDREG